jgi:hypothetical protein
LNNTPELLTVAIWNTFVLAIFDLHGQVEMVRGFKWGLERRHLVDDAAERPNVTFFVILLLLYLLRAHIIRGADVSHREHRLLVEDPGKAEVSQLRVLMLVQKDVAWLQVSMEDLLWAFRLGRVGVTPVNLSGLLSPVAKVKSTDNLRKNLPDEFLANEIVGLDAALYHFL